jgi:hypothetical protein
VNTNVERDWKGCAAGHEGVRTFEPQIARKTALGAGSRQWNPLKIVQKAGHQWLTPVNLATQEPAWASTSERSYLKKTLH